MNIKKISPLRYIYFNGNGLLMGVIRSLSFFVSTFEYMHIFVSTFIYFNTLNVYEVRKSTPKYSHMLL